MRGLKPFGTPIMAVRSDYVIINRTLDKDLFDSAEGVPPSASLFRDSANIRAIGWPCRLISSNVVVLQQQTVGNVNRLSMSCDTCLRFKATVICNCKCICKPYACGAKNIGIV